jgi:hypothetical protein
VPSFIELHHQRDFLAQAGWLTTCDPEFLRISDEIWSLIEEEAARINVVANH